MEDGKEIGQADGEFGESAEALGGAWDGIDADGEGDVGVKAASEGRGVSIAPGAGLPPRGVFVGPDEVGIVHFKKGGCRRK